MTAVDLIATPVFRRYLKSGKMFFFNHILTHTEIRFTMCTSYILPPWNFSSPLVRFESTIQTSLIVW